MTSSAEHFAELSQPQQLRVNRICNDYESARARGEAAIREFVARESDVVVQNVLLKCLVEIDIEFRIRDQEPVSAASYLQEFPVLNSDWLQAQIPASHSGNADARQIDGDELLTRLRASSVLSEDDLQHAIAFCKASSDSPVALGQHLVASGCLTDFQLESIIRRPDDPLVLGDYVILSQVGQGGMGTVYRARHQRMERIVALKVLRREAAQASDLTRRFLREVRVAAKLAHPNIVTAYDAGEQHGIPFLVSEYIEGQDLAAVVRERGPFPIPLAIEIAAQMCRGLSYAHQKGVVHRDIKPSNVLLDDAGDVKLLDVGLAKISAPGLSDDVDSELTTTGIIMGTVDYMAPEQAQNTRLADERSDIYGVGCTLYFLLTGSPPFSQGTAMERLLAHREQPVPDLRDLDGQTPDALQGLLETALAKKSVDRFQSADDFLKALLQLQETTVPDVVLDVKKPAVSHQSGDETIEFSDRQPATKILPDQVPELHQKSTASQLPTSNSRARFSPVWRNLSLALLAAIFLAGAFRLFGGGDRLSESASITGELRPDVPPESTPQEFADAAGLQSPITSLGLSFVLIPPGTCATHEGDSVAMSAPIYMSTTEVTISAFRPFHSETDYQTTSERSPAGGFGKESGTWGRDPRFGWQNLGEIEMTDEFPAAGLSFIDAERFCEWASRTLRRTVRLPTRDEWIYASSARQSTPWAFGDDESLSDGYAWTSRNSRGQMHETGLLTPNRWGLFDMHGNEAEWCVDSENADGESDLAYLMGGHYGASPQACTHTSGELQSKNEFTHAVFRVVIEP